MELQAGRCKRVKTGKAGFYSQRVYQEACGVKLKGPSGDIVIAWTESLKATPATSFLDLPKELRDMIYHELREQLPHTGIHWMSALDSSLQKRPYLAEHRTEVLHGLAVMQTCHQIHSEFAEVLYSDPLDLRLGLADISSIAFPRAYTSLVRMVYVTLEVPYHYGPARAWLNTVQVANSVAKIFPALQTLRVGWCTSSGFQRWAHGDYSNEDWDFYVGRTEGDWETRVKRLKRLLRKHGREMGVSPTVPHQFELVLRNPTGHEAVAPLVEAALALRRKPPNTR
ncbi:hypothetical protein K458DRAFT_386179 [Lentithecium fluviatile CBS 122367]|uniref:F-box domain-containing protein n=1 Tax=Lentithecium fluviatile CBS 122367 TaxID=1168545 RepID=A0A6G1JAV7_9PLEO|nr:hypothetical protein K458DRAFT_386179 [Lentithecium fluviatile CBS 122367]